MRALLYHCGDLRQLALEPSAFISEEPMSRINCALLFSLLILAPHSHPAAQSKVESERRPTATVSGQVTVNGEPLGGVVIRFFPEPMAVSGNPRSPHEAVTDEHGNYRVTDIVASKSPKASKSRASIFWSPRLARPSTSRGAS